MIEDFIIAWDESTTYNIGDCIISHPRRFIFRKKKRFNKSRRQRVVCKRFYKAIGVSNGTNK